MADEDEPMGILLRKASATALMLCLALWPELSRAGMFDFASDLASWWSARSVGVHAMEGDPDISEPGPDSGDDAGGDASQEGADSEVDDGADDEDDSPAGSGGIPGMCLVPQEPPKTECAVGSGFLCVSTPPGSVAGTSFILEGTIDRESSTLASIKIVAQNDYTKTASEVDTSMPGSDGCGNGSFSGPFCLDAKGRFAARVDLPEDGPYTVAVTASRLTGETVTRDVRTSRVIPTELTPDDISFDPDVKVESHVDATHVSVTVDLLGECQFCDFIGASTGGVTVTVENLIVGPDGVEKSISCATTMEQGGQGRFMLGVPVGTGQNSLTVRACNAAAMGAGCPAVSGMTFGATGAVDAAEAVEFLSPDPRPSYDKDEYPKMPWKFRIAGAPSCVSVRLNREAPEQVCAGADGVYSVDLEPKEGINVVTILGATGADDFAWTFGWGRILSPHGGSGGAISVPSAAELGLAAGAVHGVVVPAINNYLASDEFRSLLDDVLSDMGGDGPTASDAEEEILALIPKCKAGGGGDFSAELRGKPEMGDVLIKYLTLENGEMGFSLVMKGVELGLDVIPEKDLPPLPLVISFRKAKLDIELVSDKASDGGPRLLLSSPHEDCDYKSGTYCKHVPAPLIPKNIVGGATSWGGFLKCDMSLAKGKAKDACEAINSLNAQTGILGEVVLDALNEALYCGGSSALTRAARQGIDLPPVRIGCAVRGGCTEGIGAIVPLIRIPIGVSMGEGLEISTGGLLVDAGLSFGDEETYAFTPDEFRIASAGIVASEGLGAGALGSPGGFGGDLNLALSLDAVNALIFTATAQGDGRGHRGALDIDVHEPFFENLGFDFAKECDAYVIPAGGEDEKPTLCHIRPRVSELLGTALTTYGYLPGNHPLMMAVRGNRALGPRIEAVDLEDLSVVIQDEELSGEGGSTPVGSLLAIDIGGLMLSFYALEVDEGAGLDEYGNPSVKLDSGGRPVIMSMRPGDPDPWNGAIISFDLTLMLGAEMGRIEPDPEGGSDFTMKIGVLGDRSRLVLTPVPGTNATTVPAAGLVSSLAEKLKLAISALGEFDIPIPREIALEADDDGLFGMLGLAKIGFGDEGLSLEFDVERNKAMLAVSAVLTQILHVNGGEKVYVLP